MHILIIEDDATHLKLAHVVLESAGCSVATVASAEAALAAIAQRRPEVILLDLKLPQMNGLELTRCLKHDPRTRQIPVVAVTAYSEDYRRAEALRAGCDAYLQKPLDTRTLAASLADVLPKGEG